MNPSLEETIYRDFITSSPTTGAAADADSTPTAEVFEDANDTPILTPTVTKRTSKTGNYRVPIACTAANGFEAGKSYNVVVSATVGGVAGKAAIATFQVRTRDTDDVLPTSSYTTPPTAAAISTQVASDLASAHGAGSWATATGFSTHSATDVWAAGTRTLTAATNITSTGGTTVPQTGDSFARIGATGSGLTSLAPAATALSTVQWTNTRAGYLDNLSAGAVAQASVCTEARLAILNGALTESYAADGSTFTLTQGLYMIWSTLAQFAIAGTTITTYRLDGSTTALTFTLDSSTTPTSRTRAT